MTVYREGEGVGGRKVRLDGVGRVGTVDNLVNITRRDSKRKQMTSFCIHLILNSLRLRLRTVLDVLC